MLFFKQSTDLLAEAVRFELTAPYGTTVFKTAALNRAQPHFLNWYPGRDLNPQQNCLLNSRVYLIVCATGALEVRVRFELTTLRICNPIHWTTLAPHYIWLPTTDSNRDQEFWRLVCYRYTNGK